MPTTRRELQRRLGRYSDEISVGIERVDKREEVVGVGAATVMKDQRPARLPTCRADLVGQHVKVRHLRDATRRRQATAAMARPESTQGGAPRSPLPCSAPVLDNRSHVNSGTPSAT